MSAITINVSAEAFAELQRALDRVPEAGEQVCPDLLDIRELRIRRGVPKYAKAEPDATLAASSEPQR